MSNEQIILLLVLGIAIVALVSRFSNRTPTLYQLTDQTEELLQQAGFPSPDIFQQAFLDRLIAHFRPTYPSKDILAAMVSLARKLYVDEQLSSPLPPLPFPDIIEEGKYKDELIKRARKTANAEHILNLINTTLFDACVAFANRLPPIAFSPSINKTGNYSVYLSDVLSNPGHVVNDILHPFLSRQELRDEKLFTKLRAQVNMNYEALKKGKTLVPPIDYKGDDVVGAYLSGTPLRQLFTATLPFDFDDKSRMEHFHLCAGSGSGKTQLIQSLILRDLQKEDPPALIIIDSQQDMLDNIQRLALFNGKLADRLVIIDPIYNPCLNMFDTTTERLKNYSQTDREQIEAGIIELYNYVFGAIAAELTSKQNVAFSYVVRLMLATPEANLHTLLELMERNEFSKFLPIVAQLDPTAQSFFQNQFLKKEFASTRQQIARRLYSVLSVPSFDRMFSTTENKLDMFECIQSRKIVLINTRKALLKTDACALFGRYMIAQTMAAAFERAATQHRPPAYLIVDEFGDYADDSMESLLTQARKYNLGVLFAHQAMSQLSSSLQSIIAANTSIKVAGGLSDRDARALAADMRTTTDFLTNLKKTDRSAQFGAYIRNKTGRAVTIEVPFGVLEAQPRMTEAPSYAGNWVTG